MRASIRLRNTLLAIGLALALGCSADDAKSPTAPTAPPLPPASTVNVTVSSSAAALEVNATEPATITIRAVRSDTGIPVPNLTQAAVTTSLGGFGSVGGPAEVTLELVNGQATVSFFPGPTVGTASLRAQVSTGVGLTSVQIGEAGVPATFFLASVQPNTGSPQGGETVTIHGGGFSDPIRVTIDGVPANIQNATASTIRVTTPRCTDDDCFVAGAIFRVDVAVTINLNEEGQATDTLSNGFSYVNGGGGSTLQPTIFSLTPSSGPNEGGTQVTINGDGFEAPVSVEFGTDGTYTAAQIVSVTRTRIVVLSPPATGFGQGNLNRLVNIRVTNQASGRFTVASAAYRYGVDLIITAMGPTSGPTEGGQLVTIYGQGFDEPVAVSFTGCSGIGSVGQAAISVSGTEIVIRTSAVVPTTCGDIVCSGVRVVNIETGDFADAGIGYVYDLGATASPVISSVSPSSGSQSGGTPVTILGANFASLVSVSFVVGGDGFSAPITSSNGTTIHVTTPAIPNGSMSTETCNIDADPETGTRYISTPGDLVVTNLDNGCSITLPGAFLFNPANTACQGD